jgi:hypothetical protein
MSVVGREAGSPEETPALISLVVSRYQKNSQVWEKTYPGCKGVAGGNSMREAEDQSKLLTAGQGEAGLAAAAAKPGDPSRIARSSGRAGFLFKLRFGASFTLTSTPTNALLRLDR